MEIREVRTSDAEEITLELWLPLAREMEEISDYNKLSEDIEKGSLIKYREEKINDDSVLMFVAEARNSLSGIITCSICERSEVFSAGKYGKINEIFVKKKFRKQGVATKLLNKVAEELPDDAERIELNVNKENSAAKTLYEKNGFRVEKHKMLKDL